MRRKMNASMITADVAEQIEQRKKPKKRNGIEYEILSKDDAKIVDGRFAGKTVKELIQTVEGRDYVGSLWSIAPQELRDVIRIHFSA